MDIGQEILDLLEGPLRDAGRDIEEGADEIKDYITERAKHLASIRGERGFELAVQAEADNVALRIALSLTAQADAADARIVGILEGALGIAGRLLV